MTGERLGRSRSGLTRAVKGRRATGSAGEGGSAAAAEGAPIAARGGAGNTAARTDANDRPRHTQRPDGVMACPPNHPVHRLARGVRGRGEVRKSTLKALVFG